MNEFSKKIDQKIEKHEGMSQISKSENEERRLAIASMPDEESPKTAL